MIANLIMYARPELAQAHETFWALIRGELMARGIDAPTHLAQDAPEFDVWTNPKLVLSQTCGMPYRLWLRDRVTLVGTPDYALEGCPPGHYRSAIVVRTNDTRRNVAAFKDATFAYNVTHSQSGFAAAHTHTKNLGFWFENRLKTGAHRQSAQAVACGKADIAAIDAMSWLLIKRYERFATQLRILEWTEPTPGLPLITSLSLDAQVVFDAVQAAIAQTDAETRRVLGIHGIVRLPAAAYTAAANPPEDYSSLP